jgi:uncharacterized protein YgiM (DUF1202 family)
MNRRSFLRLSGIGLLSSVAAIATTGQAEAAPAQASTPVICVEAQTNVNVRAAASLRGRIWGKLYGGEQAIVLALSADRNWWCIRWGRGTAWVSADPGLTQPVAWRR